MYTWRYQQPVEIVFESGITQKLKGFLQERNLPQKGILVCDSYFVDSGLAAELTALCGDRLAGVFSDIKPNPSVKNVQDCAAAMAVCGAEFAVVIGGGSAIDCAKMACAIAKNGGNAAKILAGEEQLPSDGFPLIAVPTTAGTGSEVTGVSVLDDPERGVKAPVVGNALYPKIALIDPELTLSMSPYTTAATGMDALSHALEAFWSKNHLPVCDALALEAARKILNALPIAYKDGANYEARAEMCEASVLAGLAFAVPRTAGVHACSFPLTNRFGLSHGEACAFTLDTFTRINANAENGRVQHFARQLGFEGAEWLAEHIAGLKRDMGLKLTLAKAGIDQKDLPELVQLSRHPNLLNNPVEMTDEKLMKLYMSLI